MTDIKRELSLAFMQAQPEAAAAVLEQQSLINAAALLNEMPHDEVMGVLNKMLPQHIARLGSHLSVDCFTYFLSKMTAFNATIILRFIERSARKKILECLPAKFALTCKLLLSYEQEVVGAWMSTDFIALSHDATIKMARVRLSAIKEGATPDVLYIISRDNKLQGIVNSTRLAWDRSDKPIISIMKKDRATLSARTTIITAMSHPVWEHSDSVVLTNKKQQVVGVLHHVELRRALRTLSPQMTQTGDMSLLAGLQKAYGYGLFSLLNTVTEVVSSQKGG